VVVVAENQRPREEFVMVGKGFFFFFCWDGHEKNESKMKK
jgi:hypothetical protein